MNEDRFNPDMLRLARDRREMTQAELARASGVTQALISKMEHGFVAQPSDDVLQKLASTLQCPVRFFVQRERLVGLPHFHLRERAKMPSKPLARLSAMVNINRQHITKLLRSYDLAVAKPIPQLDLDTTGLTPEKVAERVRAYWMLPRGPVSNVVELVEEAGGIVILSRFGTALLSGMSFRSEGLPPIFLMNQEVPGDRFRVSLAQELGHIIMHTIPDEDAKMQEEARRFAIELLMPSSDIKPYLIEARLTILSRVKSLWKVPVRDLINRAKELKLITDSQYKSLTGQYKKAFSTGEPIDVPIEQPSRLRDIIAYHRDRLGYTAQEMADLLSVTLTEVEGTYSGKTGIRLVVSN